MHVCWIGLLDEEEQIGHFKFRDRTVNFNFWRGTSVIHASMGIFDSLNSHTTDSHSYLQNSFLHQ